MTSHMPLLIAVFGAKPFCTACAGKVRMPWRSHPLGMMGPATASRAVVVAEHSEASHCPHEGFVFLDSDAHKKRWVATDMRTAEQVELEVSGGASPSLIYDEQGFGCIVYEGDAEPTLLEYLFSVRLFRSGEGVISVVVETSDGTRTSAALEVLASLWRSASVTVPVCILRSEVLGFSTLRFWSGHGNHAECGEAC